MIGKVAFVTGAGKRLGRAVAMRLAQGGADVIVHYRSSETEALEVAKGIEAMGRRSIAMQADLARVDEVRKMLGEVRGEFGRLDVLVNSAANFKQTDFATTTEEIWDTALDANLKSVFFCCQAAAPLLKEARGAIINFADVGG